MWTPQLTDWLSLTACVGQLVLAVVAIRASGRDPLAPLLARFCLVLFGWNFASWAHQVFGDPLWRSLDITISPWTKPVALHFALAFTGSLRRMRRVLQASYVAFGALSVASSASFVSDSARALDTSGAWAWLHAGIALPAVVFAMVLCVRHLRTQSQTEEQLRTRIVIAAFLVGTVFGGTELLADVGLPVPRLGNLAALVITVLLSFAALKWHLVSEQVPQLAWAYALGVAAMAMLGYITVVYALKTSLAVVVTATALFTFLLLAVVRQLTQTVVQHRERTAQFTTMGRMSAQLAHDLKNPLAAIRGAAQFLAVEQERSGASEVQAEYLRLITSQVDRLTALVDRYARLGSLKPRAESLVVDAVVEEVVRAQRLTIASGVQVETELDCEGVTVCADRDLLSAALENLLRNAREAMPDGGEMLVETAEGRPLGARRSVAIRVRDSGMGMNARDRERAFSEFFTTKASGSGLGLPFVRRVAHAHGGSVAIESQEGQGTRVSLYLPAEGGM